MGGVFWRFFLAIWLTLIGAIAFVMLMNSYLRVLPPKGDMRDFRERFAMDTISSLVRMDDIAAARSYIAALADLPPVATHLSLAPTTEARDEKACRLRTPEFALAYAPGEQKCYRINTEDPPLTLLEAYAPPVLPPLAALVTSSISAFLLARYLVRPVMTLRLGLNALASGNFGVRIGWRFGRRKDEIAALGHDFDATATKLEELQEGQKRLFHDVSHELRSPLSRMQAALGLLKKNPARLDAVIPRMEREIERLDSLVEEILTLARLGSPSGQGAERQEIDVMDLLGAIIDDAAFEAQSRGIVVRFAGAESFVSAVNGELIYRALENVMRNAVKYAHEASVISVTATITSDQGMEIAISNSGPVVAPQDIDKIFEPFTRLLENESVVGHGLGLAIARRAIAAHGGKVSARGNPGGGLTVTLHLPAGSSA